MRREDGIKARSGQTKKKEDKYGKKETKNEIIM